MRKNNTAAFVGLVFSGVLTACGLDGDCSGRCGTLVVNITSAPETLLPVLATSDNAQSISDLIFFPLAGIGDDLNVVGDVGFEPRLAERWTFEDSITIVFELDRRARWQDGTPVTARDVLFTFDLYRDPAVNSIYRETLGEVVDVTARDEHTVAFKFSRPYPEQFYDVTYPMRIHPAHLLDSIPRDQLRGHPWTRNPVGNGPYRLARWDAGSTVELHADTSFYLGAPGFARIIVQVVPDNNTSLSQFMAGEADYTDFLGGNEEVARVESAEHLRAVPKPSSVYFFVAFNHYDPDDPGRQHPLFSSQAVRRAVTMAINRDVIAQVLFGDNGVVTFGPVSIASPLWHYSIPPVPFDTAQTLALLRSEGWDSTDDEGYLTKDGRRLSFELLVPTSSGGRRRSAVIIKDQLASVGVELIIAELEGGSVEDRTKSGRFDAHYGAWLQDPKPTGSMKGSWSTGGSSNLGRYSNPRFDAMLDELDRVTDATRAQELWLEALQLIQDDAPAVWMATLFQPVGIHARIENVTIRADRWGATAWRWTVSPDKMLPRDRIGIQ